MQLAHTSHFGVHTWGCQASSMRCSGLPGQRQGLLILQAQSMGIDGRLLAGYRDFIITESTGMRYQLSAKCLSAEHPCYELKICCIEGCTDPRHSKALMAAWCQGIGISSLQRARASGTSSCWRSCMRTTSSQAPGISQTALHTPCSSFGNQVITLDPPALCCGGSQKIR